MFKLLSAHNLRAIARGLANCYPLTIALSELLSAHNSYPCYPLTIRYFVLEASLELLSAHNSAGAIVIRSQLFWYNCYPLTI